jgi:hypothetical protein
MNGNVFREYKVKEDFVKYQYVVPEHERKAILYNAHNSVFSGHLGHTRTIDRIKDKYY